MTGMHDITVVIGPTAIGKSDFSIGLAQETGGQIISADAFQVYQHMTIGTAKVLSKDQGGIPHHLVDILPPDAPYSVVEFLNRTNDIITSLRESDTPIIICGGTGFYINAFLYGFDFGDADDTLHPTLRRDLETLTQDELWETLIRIDPDAGAHISPNNRKRTIRGLDLYYKSGLKPSENRNRHSHARSDTAIIGLTASREIIYSRINDRVDSMIESGLVDEVRDLLREYPPTCLAFQALGYKEVIAYLNDDCSYEEMIELIKQNTRHFAKHQMTWFRRFSNVNWIDITTT